MTDPDRRVEQLSALERSVAGLQAGLRGVRHGAQAAWRGTRAAGRYARDASDSGQRAMAPWVAKTRVRAEPVLNRVRPVLGVVTGLGWGIVLIGLGSWVLGWLFGWAELLIVAAACLVVLVLCALLTIGRTRLTVTLDVSPHRVVAGNPAAGRIKAANASRTRLLPVLLELPVGVSRAQFPLRRLRMGEVQEHVFSLATTRRGVVPVGPATTVRGDPFGLFRRDQAWTDVVELIVHPITVSIDSLGAGVLRDLEGQSTNETSTSDLAFHTLREYAPGDDWRYIHWRSSARATTASGETKLLVRQFLDTRRSHLCAIVDGRARAYLDEIDFETAISVAASVVRQAFSDDVGATVLAAQAIVAGGSLAQSMDAFSRAELSRDTTLVSMASHAAQIALDTTVALLVTGARTGFAELQMAAMHFAPEVTVVAVRVDPEAAVGLVGLARLTVLTLPQLSGLRVVLGGAMRT